MRAALLVLGMALGAGPDAPPQSLDGREVSARAAAVCSFSQGADAAKAVTQRAGLVSDAVLSVQTARRTSARRNAGSHAGIAAIPAALHAAPGDARSRGILATAALSWPERHLLPLGRASPLR